MGTFVARNILTNHRGQAVAVHRRLKHLRLTMLPFCRTSLARDTQASLHPCRRSSLAVLAHQRLQSWHHDATSCASRTCSVGLGTLPLGQLETTGHSRGGHPGPRNAFSFGRHAERSLRPGRRDEWELRCRRRRAAPTRHEKSPAGFPDRCPDDGSRTDIAVLNVARVDTAAIVQLWRGQ